MTLLTEFRPSIFHRLFSRDARQRFLRFSPYFLTLTSVDGVTQISYSELDDLTIERRLIWSRITFKLKTAQEEYFGWVTNSAEAKIFQILKARSAETKYFDDLNASNAKWIEACTSWYLSATRGERWVTYREIDEILQEHEGRLTYLWSTDVSDLPMFKQELASHIKYMTEVKKDKASFRTKCNKEFEAQELKRYEKFFDEVLASPLTFEQRRAVIVDEDAELVVAAAGSGKTTTIKSKAAYLVHKGFASPHEILVISFNKNVQQDLEKSLASPYPSINISTFHALGLKILAEAKGQKPSLTELAESREKLGEYLDGLINQIYEDNYLELAEFFVSYAKPYRDQFDFKSMGEYIAHIRSVGMITFNGETVKSLEELELANFLYANGVNYLYEEAYEHPVASVKKRQYKPDFYLPDYGIYIEHFAIDINGKTPPFINEREYLESRDWKVLTHQQFKTKLIQTFSHEKRSATLTGNLRRNLAEHGVSFSPMPKDQLLSKLNSSGYISELGMLLGTFLNLFKGSLLTIGDLPSRLPDNDADLARARKFIEIFEQVFQRYQDHLSSASLIDFNDMIRLSAQALDGGHELKDIKYVLIDEFQDISIGRAEFIKSLLKSTNHAKLVAVGDDWQSIYRFSGSDISVMTSFEEHFGRHEVRMLPETFRFDQMVESVASRFVLKNEAQIKKKVIAKLRDNSKSVILWHPQEESGSLLESIAQHIPVASAGKTSILVLARYNFYKDQLAISELKALRPDLELTFSSVHAAKGAEADYAILVGVKSGRYSFPSEIADDPLLDLVLSAREHFEHAEERRLLYVALTRTKRAVYVVGDPSAESTFFSELIKDPDVDKSYLGRSINRRCTTCQAPMNERNSQHGLFFGCSNYPICNITSRPCIACGRGFLVHYGVHIVCDNPRCNKEYEVCPECEDGILVRREGKYGAFLGCTNFASGDCSFTRNIQHFE
jgi:DNA helicase-4